MAFLAILGVIGVALGASFSAAETALQRLTRSHVADLRQEGRPRAESCARILERRTEVMVGTAFARLVAELTAAVAITLLIADLLPTWWSVLLASVGASVLLATLVMGASPREYGRRNPGLLVHRLAPVLSLLGHLARPWIALTRRRAKETVRSIEEREQAEEDLRDMVDLVTENEHIEDIERAMLQSVFELRRTLTREVMVPRTDMITLASDSELDKALALFVRSGFSRVPVIGENVDDILGVAYLKDALRASRRPGSARVTVAEVMRPARLVPEMKPVDELMREMQTELFHIAIVIDEYGGVAGLVTMEDLIEELVGEVQDEHDAHFLAVQPLEDGAFRIPARLPVTDLGELFDLDLDDDDVDTAGGLLTKTLGRVPIEGAEVTVHGLRLLAERSGGRRRQIVTMLVQREADEAVEE
nr:HlyC/CorC family transporter [Actinomycetales bacterium]